MADDLPALVFAFVRQAEADIFGDIQPGKDAAFLKDEQPPRVGTTHWLALDQHFAARRLQKAGNDVE